MEALLAALEDTAVAELLRVSRWGYAATNTAHVLGVALLVGSIIPLNLRFLGLWPAIPRHHLVRVLVPVAVTGFGLAVVAGFLLFSVRAQEYAGIGFLQAKLTLIMIAALSAALLHHRHGLSLEGASGERLALHAVISTLCWLGAMICGRLIAFAD